MDEPRPFYQVGAGMPDETFIFFYPRKSLAEIEAAGPAHGAAAYRDATGERGRERTRDVNRSGVEFSQSYIFRLSPAMSTLTKAWSDAGPFWNRPAPVAAQREKKR